ncbi:MAG: prepilin peptidase [Thermoplasmata archaeon]|nr:prepilin peptidase [Thermoplasmata archaeon]
MMDVGLTLDVVRLVVGVGILGYASYTDIKTRMASNTLWIVMGSVGAALLVVQYFTVGIDNLLSLVFIPILIGAVYVLFYVGLIFGGADAKAIMALSILTPLWPHLHGFPLHPSVMPFAWSIFSNAIVLFLIIPPMFLVYNAIKRDVEFPYALIGYRMDVEEAKKKFVWPLEKIVDGKRKLMFMPEEFDAVEHIEELEKTGRKKIWVTPKIPFMIPLLMGFVFAFFFGDILFAIVSFLI